MAKYEYNFERIPKKLDQVDVVKAFIAFAAGLDPKISQRDYDEMSDWCKTYWMATQPTTKKDKS